MSWNGAKANRKSSISLQMRSFTFASASSSPWKLLPEFIESVPTQIIATRDLGSREKHFKTIYHDEKQQKLGSLFLSLLSRKTNHSLPGSIVAANNKDGRHKTIILCKSNIILSLCCCVAPSVGLSHFSNPLFSSFLFHFRPSLRSLCYCHLESLVRSQKHFIIYLWIS